MTDWTSAGAMLMAGIIVGVVFLYAMKRRADHGDAELRDMKAKRDALVQQLRDFDGGRDEQKRLEREAANVLRQIDERKAKTKKREERPQALIARQAAIKGFAWGAGSVLVLVGIGWYVTQKAQPREAAPSPQAAPMQQQQQQPQADPQLQQFEAAVAQRPDDLGLRTQLARAYLDRENLMGVFEQTQYILKRTPHDPQALTYQALVRIAMGQVDTAMPMLREAIRHDPRFLDAYVTLAWAQTTAGKNSEAEATIKEAEKAHPEQKGRLAEVLVKMEEQAKTQRAAVPPNHPAVEAPGAASAAAASSNPAAIHVTLRLADGVAPPQQGIIFVTARAAGVSAGPPAAVKRLPLSRFPLSFDLSAADSMMGQPLPPKIRLEARVDSDGDPLTRDPKDPAATVDNVVVGSTVALTLH